MDQHCLHKTPVIKLLLKAIDPHANQHEILAYDVR